jgi:hypothetical protein
MNGETCDRCGPTVSAARAVTFPLRAGFGLLTFCDHHAAQYAPNVPGATVSEIAPQSVDTYDRIATSEAAK